MTAQCPHCAQEINPFGGPSCPFCGKPTAVLVPPAEDPRVRLVRFHTTMLAMTPRTWGIPSIVVANALVFLAMLLAGGHLLNPGIALMLDWGANFGPLTLTGQWWRLLTCMFLHFGIIHIAFNMYVLWQIGHFVERLVGNIGLLVLYLMSGLAASIASLAWNPSVVSAGASGAVFGVCGALLGFIAFRRDTIPGEVIKSLRSSLITFVIYNVVFSMIVPAIDMAAHLGGFAYGLVCGMVLSQPIVIGSVIKRWQRNLLLFVGSAIVLPAAFLLLPPAPLDTISIRAEIQFLDQQAASTFNDLIIKWQDKSIDNERFLEALQNDVTPLWQEALERSETLVKEGGTQNKVLWVAMQTYLTNRLDSLQALVIGLRDQNDQQLAKFSSTWAQVNQQRQQVFPSRVE